MKSYHFRNEQAVSISDGVPNKITSILGVQNTGGNITDINVKVDIEHTWTSDLQLRLINPAGLSILLANGQGGSGDNFNETVFDDDASSPIGSANAPFNGILRPEESIGQLIGGNANGTWSLEISDTQFQDGGALKNWELEIITDEPTENTGPFLFHNRTPKNISAAGPSTLESQINVQGLETINIDSVCITLDVEHTFTSDLKVSIIGPTGIEVLLVDREGGGGDHFHDTVFDDDAADSIAGSVAPFTGSYKPEGQLSDFNGTAPNGIWVLKITDQANLDGGSLKSWTIAIKSDNTPSSPRPFEIKVRFLGGLSASQQAIFQEAANRWSEVITANLPSIQTDIGVVDDIVIDAEGKQIDGQGGILGQAGPTKLRPGSLLPARGIMQFDSADLQKMEDDGELIDVIIHEMGHVLGIGTLWTALGHIQGSGTNNPVFSGTNAMAEYAALKNIPNPTVVPIANTGGAGTREGHWRESVFDSELMTGYDDPGRNALSRLTIASLQDIGYQVDYNKADTYILPFGLLSATAIEAKHKHQCQIIIPDFEILPEENLI